MSSNVGSPPYLVRLENKVSSRSTFSDKLFCPIFPDVAIWSILSKLLVVFISSFTKFAAGAAGAAGVSGVAGAAGVAGVAVVSLYVAVVSSLYEARVFSYVAVVSFFLSFLSFWWF